MHGCRTLCHFCAYCRDCCWYFSSQTNKTCSDSTYVSVSCSCREMETTSLVKQIFFSVRSSFTRLMQTPEIVGLDLLLADSYWSWLWVLPFWNVCSVLMYCKFFGCLIILTVLVFKTLPLREYSAAISSGCISDYERALLVRKLLSWSRLKLIQKCSLVCFSVLWLIEYLNTLKLLGIKKKRQAIPQNP